MKIILIALLLFVSVNAQHKIQKESIMGNDIVSYTISDARIQFSQLDSLGAIIDGTGSINFLIVFQDSLGQKVFDKRVIVSSTDFKALGIKEDKIYKYIKKKFKLK